MASPGSPANIRPSGLTSRAGDGHEEGHGDDDDGLLHGEAAVRGLDGPLASAVPKPVQFFERHLDPRDVKIWRDGRPGPTFMGLFDTKNGNGRSNRALYVLWQLLALLCIRACNMDKLRLFDRWIFLRDLSLVVFGGMFRIFVWNM